MIVRILLIDTCGEAGSVALAEDRRVLRRESLPARTASAQLLPAIARLMQDFSLRELDAIGVVSGPGSFTGVRVGMAAAKGLCEGAGLRLIAVSRLAVLVSVAGLQRGYAVFDAGRGGLYVRDVNGLERLIAREAFKVERGELVAVAEAALAAELQPLGARLYALDAGSALDCVLDEWKRAPLDAALVDANYVRGEHEIYAAKPSRGSMT